MVQVGGGVLVRVLGLSVETDDAADGDPEGRREDEGGYRFGGYRSPIR
ncbi:hypothetical protein [Haladaptatus halobius]|nr:hypothetical protein [Haladaptatus halobius]